MSVHGIQRGPAPLRGTQRLILLHLRRHAYFLGPVGRLGEILAVTDRAVWLALAGLAQRRLIHAHGVGTGLVSLVITRRGRDVPVGAALRT